MIFKDIPKLDLIASKDELRPSFTYIKVDKDYMVATDGYHLIWCKTSLVFDDVLIESLTIDKPFYIKRVNWKSLYKSSLWEFKGDLLKITKRDGTISYVDIERDINYPEWRNIVNFNPAIVPLERVAIEPVLLNNISKAFHNLNVKIEFTGTFKPIYVVIGDQNWLPLSDLGAILMPKGNYEDVV